MAGPTLIQIKRSQGPGALAAPASLANGELGYTSNGDILYIGIESAVVPIGGERVPGVLTANQAIVTNSTNMIDKILFGNSTVNATANSIAFSLANSTISFSLVKPSSVEQGGNYYLKADGSWSTVTGATADPAGANTNIQYNDSGTMNGSDAFAFIETTNTVHVGTATINTTVNATAIVIANSTVTYTISKPTAAEVSAANYYLASDSTWKQVVASGDLDDLSDVVIATPANNQFLVYDEAAAAWENHAAGNGFTFAGHSPAVLAAATSGLVVNTTGVWVDAANGITVDSSGVGVLAGTDGGLVSNATGVWVFAGSGLLTNATGVHVGTGNGIAVDADAVRVVAGTDGGLISNATGLWVDPGTGVTVNSLGVSIGQAVGTTDNVTFANVVTTDMTVSGNLNVTGTLTTVDATNLVVNDSIIALARNNGADTLDIGLYGQYNDGTERFTGLIWDTTADTWELFANTTAEPTTTLDTGGTGFVRSTLSSYLKTGWGTGVFTASPTGVTITANSTWAVALTANSLSLSTPLPGTSGGTGLGTIAEDAILVANATNGFTALALGGVGTILQSNGTALVYDTLDGGTF